MGLLRELRLGAIHGRASEFLSASVPRVAEDQFHSERDVSMGMAPAQRCETPGSCGLAGTTGAETAARSHRRVNRRKLVRAASGTERIGGVGHGARSVDVRGNLGCVASIPQVDSGRSSRPKS